MKTLYIIRHAKSSWKDTSLDDFDRPLNKRGRRDAPLMGEILQKRGIKVDLILSSPAVRAKATAQIVVQKMNNSQKIFFNQEIYEATSFELNALLQKIDNKYSSVFIFGHNTGFSDLANEYVGLEENIPTCGVVEIGFECESWSEISSDNAELVSFDYPKKHL